MYVKFNIETKKKIILIIIMKYYGILQRPLYDGIIESKKKIYGGCGG